MTTHKECAVESESEDEDETDYVFGGQVKSGNRCSNHVGSDGTSTFKPSEYVNETNPKYYSEEYLRNHKYMVRQCDECLRAIFGQKPKLNGTIVHRKVGDTGEMETLTKGETENTLDNLTETDWYKVSAKNPVWLCVCVSKSGRKCSVGYCNPCFVRKTDADKPGTLETKGLGRRRARRGQAAY